MLLQTPCLVLLTSATRKWAEKSGGGGCAAPTLTQQPPQWHEGLRAQPLRVSGRKGGTRGKGLHPAPVPGRSVLSADGSG